MPAGERRENALHLLTQLGTALRANNLRQIPARIESALQALRLLRVNDLFTLFREGRELHEQDNYEGALQKFEIIRFFEPSSPINYSILVCRAEIAYAHQDYAAALPLFQEIQRSPLAPDRIRESVARQIADCQNQIHPNSPSAQVLTRALVNALGRGRVTFHIDRSSITISNGTVRVRDGLNFREGAEQILNVISCSNISAEQANSLLRELQDVARFNSAPIGTEVRFNFRAQGQTPVITWPAVSR
jgi:tetratricopeptide (TPR) repeat protein